ncbi:Fc.00g000860.m01.CDS01 [Cosmosporella sp. VM-42]
MTQTTQQAVPNPQVNGNSTTHKNGNGIHKASSQHDKETTHSGTTHDVWAKVERLKAGGKVLLNGSDLDIASVIAVAKHNCDAYVDMTESLIEGMDGSVKLLEEYLSKGYYVYGVNTGFGGSADSRTTDLGGLQSSLLQHTQSGVLTEADILPTAPNQDLGFHSMPVTWVRATMLIRCNNALRGHSGVRLRLVEAILQLLRKGMTPIIPLRGSVSASGDLMPLSYIAGMLEGSHDIMVRTNEGPSSRVVSAQEALKLAGLEPIVLGPKEGLGLINGTAASAAVGSLASYEANQLALLAQMLTAASCEALVGNAESFHPFIAAVRPHPGQIECAANVYRFLQGSKLVETTSTKNRFKAGLFQDRYALRGTPQWLGPQLEDLSHVVSQLTVELNSTSDNPVIDVKARDVYSGANFQAASVASAMERTRLSLQMVGKLLFSLSSELINPDLNKGLPPNLAADDPSLSFTMKGVDVNMAAYMSELAFLANPVTSHVQSAEMHNQPINSLALISARYTMQSIELVALMCSAHLYVVCQALDLRVLHNTYLQAVHDGLRLAMEEILPEVAIESRDALQNDLSNHVLKSWKASTPFDLKQRCQLLAESTLPVLMNHVRTQRLLLSMDKMGAFQDRVREMSQSTYAASREHFFKEQNTSSYLGGASKQLYSFVREELAIPFHHGLVEHPTRGPTASINGRPKKTIGSWVSVIYAAVRDGRIWEPMSAVLEAE